MRLLENYKQWDFFVFAVLTLLAVFNESTSVFYVIYFFWWNELIRIIIDKLFSKRNTNIISRDVVKAPILGSFFQLGIYFVFIIVFFGIIANWNNKEVLQSNVEVLLFKNWFFNSNLIFVLVERSVLHIKKQPVLASFGHFTPNMIVLHLSIILGGLMIFFVVHNFPDTFTPDNTWGAVLILSPFVVIKYLALYFETK